MFRKSRFARDRGVRRMAELRAFARSPQAIEVLEKRELLAAHIVGSASVYATIQDAVNAAPIGATINVDAGVYSELVTVYKTLTIRGPRAGLDGRANARNDRSGEAIINGALLAAGTRTASLFLNADNIVIDGFTLEGQSAVNPYSAGVHFAAGRSGGQILNNIVQFNSTGINVSSASAATPTIIRNNLFRENNQAGPHTGRAVYSDSSISGGTLTNVIIDNNVFFKNYGSDPNFAVQPAVGFEAQVASATQSNLRITNNIFDYNGKGLLVYNASNVTVSNNVFTHNRDTTSANLRFEGGVNGATVQNNLFYANGARAIRIDQKAFIGANANFTITNNNFMGNGKDAAGERTAIKVETSKYTGTLNATGNYYGAASGPSINVVGTGDTIWTGGNSIDYSGWATAPIASAGAGGTLQSPYYGRPMDVTSPIMFVDLDHGERNVAYSDTTTANQGNLLHRFQAVDMQATADPGFGMNAGNQIAWVRAGEWIEYTVNIAAPGTYDLQVRLASPNTAASPGAYHVEIDGANVTGTIAPTGTGSWTAYATQTIAGLTLPAGLHVVRFSFDANGSSGGVANFNWFQFAPVIVTPPPIAPGNLVATAANTTTVNLAWSDNADNETGFILERKTGAGGTWGFLASPAIDATTYQDNTVVANTSYVYRIRAVNAVGASANSNEAAVVTPAVNVAYLSDLPFVGTPTNGWGPVERDMSVGGANANDGPVITLNGVVYSKGLGTHAVAQVTFQLDGLYERFLSDVGIDDRQTANGSVVFQVFADNVKIYESTVLSATSATQQIDVSVAGALQLKLVVLDSGDGTQYDHADWAGARLTLAMPPAAPSGLAASPVGAHQIDLAWTDNATNETGFKIERSLNGVDGWSEIVVLGANATTYSDTSALDAKTQYFYRVRATNAIGGSGYSDVASATTLSAPTAPGGLAASAVNASQINLTWTDTSSNETNFILERSLNGVDGWIEIATPAMNATGYSDVTNVNPSTQYFYRIRATNSIGPSPDSNIASATTPAAPTVPAAPSAVVASAISASQINLTWTDNADNENGFIIERSANGIDGWSPVGTAIANTTTFKNTGLAASTKYYYRVRATNAVGQSENSNVASATTQAAPPVNPALIAAGSTWRYLDNGTNQGTAWRARTFVDTAWKSGAAQLGYGDGDEVTTVAYGATKTAKHITTYFRKTFTVADPAAIATLSMRLIRDDGAAVYLNGTEVYRSNLTTGTITYTTLAPTPIGNAAEYTWQLATINPALLVAGNNVIAVEIHQDSPSSPDISFDFELSATMKAGATAAAAPAAKTTSIGAFSTSLIGTIEELSSPDLLA